MRVFRALTLLLVGFTATVPAFAGTGTTTGLAIAPTTVVYPGNATMTVTVTPVSGTVQPSGTATINYGSDVLVPVTITNGRGSITVPTTGYPAGVYGLTAVYEGNSTFNGSTSPVVNATLQSPVTVALRISANPVALGQTESFTATVTATDGGGTPGGTVSFKTGSLVLDTLTLTNGSATLTAPATGYPTGTYPIVATYNGDTLHAAGSSSATNLSLVSDVSITTSNTPSATEGTLYTLQFSATGGTGNYSWSITSGLSALQTLGMSFTSGGVLSGTPNATGNSYPYTVQVKDTQTGDTMSAPYTLVVNAPSSSGCGVGTYSISGTVSYSGSHTGQIYIGLGSSCGGGTQGTSISSAGTFTIRGVPSGTYNLQAFMDTVGYGVANAADPTGSSTAVTVSGANATGANITLTDPATVTLSSGPQLAGAAPFNTGVVVFYNRVSNSNGIETATSYTLQWSTSSSFTTVAGSKTFPAAGKNTAVWFLNGLTNGTAYYFRAYGTSGGTPVSAYSSVYGPVTIGALTGADTVTGTVSFSGTATGPLYVVFLGASSVYVDYIANPVSAQAYSVELAPGTYQYAAILDQNNGGFIAPGDFQNIAQEGSPMVTISGPTANLDFTLPSGNGIALVYTENTEGINGGNSAYSYALGTEVDYMAKLPVAVTLLSSSNSDGVNFVGPIDVANCQTSNSSCGHGFQFNYQGFGESASVGDTYTFSVTYSDGTTGMLTYSLPAVLNAYATNLAPQTGTSSSTTPTFTWTDPPNAADYVYQFQLYQNNGGTIWDIGDEGNGNGFSSAITSITWGTDPTGEGSTPSVSSLSAGTSYGWQIQIIDNYGNQTFTQVNYEP